MKLKEEEGSGGSIYCKGKVVDNEVIGEVELYFPGGSLFRGKMVDGKPV